MNVSSLKAQPRLLYVKMNFINDCYFHRIKVRSVCSDKLHFNWSNNSELYSWNRQKADDYFKCWGYV